MLQQPLKIVYGTGECAVLGNPGDMTKNEILDKVGKEPKCSISGPALTNQSWAAMRRCTLGGYVKSQDNGSKPSHYSLIAKGSRIAEEIYRKHCVSAKFAPIFSANKRGKLK